MDGGFSGRKEHTTVTKVGATITAVTTPENATNVASYQWYADGTAIDGATEASYIVLKTDKDKKLKVVVTDTEGKTFESAESDPVVEDKSGSITLKDDNGFQSDGTALPIDTLSIEYGSSLGVPRAVVWYCNGAVKYAATLDGAGLAGAFDSDLSRNSRNVLDAGEWYVTIENTSGDIYTSNSVIVVYEGQAVLSDVSFEDDYDTADQAEIDTDVDEAILNVTFNKNYPGTLYIVDDKYNDTYTTGAGGFMTNTLDMTSTGVIAAGAGTEVGPTAYLKKVNTAAQLTNKAASAAAATQGTTGYQGAYYEDTDGAIHCKILVDLTAQYDGTIELARGTSYYLVWDQEGIETDNVGTTAKKADLNTTASATVPYLNGPASVAIKSYSKTAGTLEVNLLGSDGEVLAWMGDTAIGTAAAAGFEAIKVFGVDTNAKDDTLAGVDPETAGSVSVEKGVATLVETTELDENYAYATFKTTAGIFAEDSVTLETGIGEAAIAPMGKMVLKEDSDDPYAAKISFSGLKTAANGTVYILQGTTTGTDADAGEIIALGTDKAIASSPVEGGASSVVISNVFKKTVCDSTTGAENDYVAIFVPENEDLFTRFYSGSESATTKTGSDNPAATAVEAFSLVSNATSYGISGVASGLNVADTTSAATTAVLDTFNQFGTKMAGTAIRSAAATETTILASESYAMSFTGASGTSADKGLKIGVRANGEIWLVASTASTVAVKDDVYKFKIKDGYQITVTCTKTATAGSEEFKVTMSE